MVPDEELLAHLAEPPKGQSGDCQCELHKQYYQAQIDLRKSRIAADLALEKGTRDTDLAGVQKFHDSMFEVSKGSIDRAQSGAEAVRNAAAAIGVIYSAVLGIAFSVDKPLPPRGLIPAFFLGLAIVLATAYVAYLVRNPSSAGWPTEGVSYRTDQRERTVAFVEWVRESVMSRSYWLRAAVVALGFGVFFLPVGFLAIGGSSDPTEAATKWPSIPREVSDPELQKILYTEQVKEVGLLRTKELSPTATENLGDAGVQIVYGLALLGVLLTFLLPSALKGKDPPQDP